MLYQQQPYSCCIVVGVVGGDVACLGCVAVVTPLTPRKCRQQRQQYRQNRGFVYFALQRYEASSKRVARRVSSRFRRQDHKQNFIMKLERQPARLHATTWSPVTDVVVSAARSLS